MASMIQCLALLLSAGSSWALCPPESLWSVTYNSPYNNIDDSYGVAVDASGGVVAVGYESRYDLGQAYNMLVRKYDKDGNYLWQQSYNSPNNNTEQATGVAVDSSGNIVEVGFEFRGDLAQGNNWVIRKYDTNGNFQWMQTYNSPYNSTDQATGVAIDSGGNIVVAGYEYRLDLAQGYNWVIRKYDTNGNFQWMQTYNSPYNSTDQASGVAVDSSGNIVVVGFEYRFDLAQGNNMVIRKYDKNGNFQWMQTYNSPYNNTDQANGVAVDSSGNIVVVGFEYRFDLMQNYNWLVRKYDASGNNIWQWSYNSPASNGEWARGVAISSGGEIVVDGYEDRADMAQSYNWLVMKIADPESCLVTQLTSSSVSRTPVGEWFTVVLSVTNCGVNAITNIFPEISALGGMTSIELIDGPDPIIPQTLNPGESVFFTWTFSASGLVADVLSATAWGTDAVTSSTIRSNATLGVQKYRILIYGPADSPRYHDVKGTTYVVWDAATWSSKTTADFAAFDAIVIGGSAMGDVNIWNVADGSKNIWSPAVTGNIVIIGSDPEEHAPANPSPKRYVQQAILFAADEPKPGPGLYVELHDYMPVSVTNLSFMSYFGVFPVWSATCGDIAHKIAIHPVLDSLNDANLGGWSCTPHAGFTSWPPGFAPLAMDVSAGSRKLYTACDGSIGFVFLIASGVEPICGKPDLKKESSQPGNVGDGDQITYRISWINYGIGTMINFTMTDTLPDNLAYKGGSLSFWAQSDGAGTPSLVSSAWATSVNGPWAGGEPPDGSRAPLAMRWVINRTAPMASAFIEYSTTVSVTAFTYEASIRNFASGTMLADPEVYTSNVVVNPLRMVVKLTKTPSGWAIPDGGDITYTINCTNYGPVTAYNMVVYDTLPDNTLYVKCEGGDSCNYDGTKVSWTMPPVVPVGYSTDLKLTVSTLMGLTSIGPNQAAAKFNDEAGAQLPVSYSNQVTVPVINPSVTIFKEADAEVVPDGGMFTYSIVVRNTGTDTAANLGVWDTLPPGAVYYGCSGGVSCSFDGTMVRFDMGAMPPGGSETVSITVSASGAGGIRIIGPNVAGESNQNSAMRFMPECTSNSVTVLIEAGAPVIIKEEWPGSDVAAGQTMEYGIAWTNTRIGVVRNLVITDTLPNGTTYRNPSLSFWAEPDYAGPPSLLGSSWATDLAGPWTDGEPPDATGPPLVLRWVVDRAVQEHSGWIRFSVDISTTRLDGDMILNGASATFFFDETVRFSNTVTAFVRQATLELTKTPSGWSIPAGHILTYTMGYSNTGSDTATNIVIWDTVPAGATYDSCSGGTSCSFAGGIVSWVLSPLLPHCSSSVSFSVSATGVIDMLGPNIASVGYSTSVPKQRPDVSSSPVDVVITPGSPVVIKTSNPAEWQVAGAPITYEISWTNTEAGNIYDLTIVDTLPNGSLYRTPSLEFWGEPDPGGVPSLTAVEWATDPAGPWTAGEPPDKTGVPLLLKWTVNRVGFGRSGYVRFGVDVSATLDEGAQIVNGAYSSFLFDTLPRWTNTVTASVRQATMEGTKYPSLWAVPAGETLTYTLSFTNAGSDTAVNVSIWDTLPAGCVYQGCSGGVSCSFDGTKVEWLLGNIKPQEAVSMGCTVRITTETPALGPNSASAYYGNTPGAVRSPAVTNPVTVAVLHGIPVIGKTASKAGACPGDSLVYRVSWGNAGVTTMYGLVLVDTFPADVTYRFPGTVVYAESDSGGTPAVTMEYGPTVAGPWTSGEPPDGSPGPLALRWSIDRVVPGKTGYVEYQCNLSGSAPIGTQVVNPVSGTVAYDSVTYAGVQAITTVAVPGSMNVTVSSPAFVSRTQLFEVTLTVKNIGGADIRGIMPDLSAVTGSALLEKRSGPVPTGPVTLVSDASQTFTWTWSAAGTGMVVFSGTATGTTCESNSLLSSGEATTTILVPAALKASAWAAPLQVDVGKGLLVVLTVTNLGEAPCQAPSAASWLCSGPGSATYAAGPNPAFPALIPGKSSLTLSWTMTGASPGWVWLTTTVSGRDLYSGYPAAAGPVTTNGVLIVVPPILKPSVTVSSTLVSIGQKVVITMTVTNTGGRPGTNCTAALWQSSGSGGAPLAGPSIANVPVLNPGAAVTFTWTATATTAGFVVWSATSTIDSGEIKSPIAVCPPVLIQVPAQLVVTATESVPGICLGRPFNLVVNVLNAGQASCTSVFVSDPLTSWSGGASVIISPVQATPAWLNGGQSRKYTWVYTASSVGLVKFTVTATGRDGNSGLSITSGPSTSPGIQVWNAGWLVPTPSGPLTVKEGEVFAVGLSVKNIGGLDVSGVKPGGYLVAGKTLADKQAGPVPAGPLTITQGTSEAFTWTYLAKNAGLLKFTLTAAGTDGGCGDVTASVDRNVEILGPRLVLVKSAPANISSSEKAVFTLTLRNLGKDTAFNVVVSDTLPAPLVYVSTSSSAVVKGSVVSWNLGTIPIGGETVLTVTGKVLDRETDVTLVNTAQAKYLNGKGTAKPPVSSSVTVRIAPILVMNVYPNPFRRSTAVRGTLKITGLPKGSKARIYTTRGLIVWQRTMENGHTLEWDGRNEAGHPVASGVYMWVVEIDKDKHMGRLIVE